MNDSIKKLKENISGRLVKLKIGRSVLLGRKGILPI